MNISLITAGSNAAASDLKEQGTTLPPTTKPVPEPGKPLGPGVDGRGMKLPDSPTFTSPELDATKGQGFLNSDSYAKNQMNDWLNSDNELMRSAGASGLKQANSRGALNSGQAAELSQKAMVDTATPFVINDANTSAKFDSANQDHFNRMDEAAVNMGFTADLAGFTNTMNIDLAERGYDAQERQLVGQIFGNLTDTMLGGMFRVMTDDGNTWDQTKANDAEGVINAMKTWYAGLYDFELA